MKNLLMIVVWNKHIVLLSIIGTLSFDANA